MSEKVKLGRRSFLVAAGASGAAAAAVVASKVAPQPAATEKPKADEKRKGYHLSEHILSYYRTTKV